MSLIYLAIVFTYEIFQHILKKTAK